MTLMAWNDKMSVNIASIDEQHKKLVNMLNELYDGVQQGKTRETLGHVLDELIDYTAAHFKYEENLFATTNYPAKETHKSEHDNLTKQVLDVQAKYKAGVGASLSLEVMTFLKNWLTNHIMGTDKRYSEHMLAHGIT
jgi:hemerythrin